MDGALHVATAPGVSFTARSLWRLADPASPPTLLFTLDEGSADQLATFRGEPYFRWNVEQAGELARAGAAGDVERLTRLDDEPSSSPRHLTRHRDRIVFETVDFRKWVSDGTARGTFELEGTADPFQLRSRQLVSLGDEAVLQGSRDFLTVDEDGRTALFFGRLLGDERTIPGAVFALDHGTFFFSAEPTGEVDLWRGDRATGEIELVDENLEAFVHSWRSVELAAHGDGVAVLIGASAGWTDGTPKPATPTRGRGLHGHAARGAAARRRRHGVVDRQRRGRGRGDLQAVPLGVSAGS